MSEAPIQSPFGKYELLARLASGGMAETYRAQLRGAAGVTKPVVIKRVLPHLAQDAAFIKAFIDEAKLSASLSHGNIAQVFDFGQVDGDYFIAMELVDGRSLHQLLDRAASVGFTRLPLPIACFIAMEVLKGLHYAHTRIDEDGKPLNLVHRDVSPENVLVSFEGQTKVVDFGVAKAAMRGRAETEPGLVKGKYLFFSPEQAVADPLDARSDVFAVGVLLYRMLCGVLPFEGQMHNVMRAIVVGRFRPPLVVNPVLPQPLVQVLAMAMATDRTVRYPSALAMQEALATFLYGQEPAFSSETVKQWMTWLFTPELQAERRSVALSARFQQQLEKWDPQSRPTAPSVPALEPVTKDQRPKVERLPVGPGDEPTTLDPRPNFERVAAEPITLEDRKAVVRTARGKPPILWFGPGAVLLGVLGYAAVNVGEQFGAEPEHVTATQEAVQRNSAQAATAQRSAATQAIEDAELARARVSIDALDWDTARQILDQCLAKSACGRPAAELRGTLLAEKPLMEALVRGEAALQKKDLAKAAAELEKSQAISLLAPRQAAASSKLWSLAASDPARAAYRLPQRVGIDPDEEQAALLLSTAKGLTDSLEYTKARELLATCRLHGQPCPEAQKLLVRLNRDRATTDKVENARKAADRGDAAGAERELRGTNFGKLPHLLPQGSAGDLLQEATLLIQANQFSAAKSRLEKCVKAEPRNFECHRLLGLAWAKLGDPAKAANEYRAFLSLAPMDNPDIEDVRQLLDHDHLK